MRIEQIFAGYEWLKMSKKQKKFSSIKVIVPTEILQPITEVYYDNTEEGEYSGTAEIYRQVRQIDEGYNKQKTILDNF